MGTLRIVVKVGTNVLVSPHRIIRRNVIDAIAGQMAELHQKGHELILISSGAVDSGSLLGNDKGWSSLTPIEQSQVAASIGQVRIVALWQEAFGYYGISAGQILRTHKDYNNTSTLSTAFHELLFRARVIAVVNDDDTRSREELKEVQYAGDNDMLSAYVAIATQANLLVFCTDVDGIHNRNPKLHPEAKRIPVITHITDQMIDGVERHENDRPTGGASKLRACQLLQHNGITGHVVNGMTPHSILDAVNQADVGTRILALQ